MSTSRKRTGRILVTGAAGNVGSRLCRVLLSRGRTVVGVDDFFSGPQGNIAPLLGHSRFRFLERCVTEPDLLAEAQGSGAAFDAVLHMAAVVSVPWSLQNPQRTMDVNHAASVELHRQAREAGVPAFVFAGSAAEYGLPASGPAREDQAGEPRSPYGWSKFLATQHIEASDYGCVLRFFNLYGPSNSPPGPYDGVVRCFIDCILRDEPFTIYGDGGQTRDFVFVEDAVEAVLSAAGLLGAPALHGVFNLGSGRGTSIQELAALLAAVSGRDLPVDHLPERRGDLRHSLADMTRAKAAGVVLPKVALERGLAITLRWFAEREGWGTEEKPVFDL